jgi:hypothetical protein
LNCELNFPLFTIQALTPQFDTYEKDNYDFFSYKNFDEKWEVANQANSADAKSRAAD